MRSMKKNKASVPVLLVAAVVVTQFAFARTVEARRVAPPKADSFQTIILPAKLAGDEGLRLAAGELAAAMNMLYGTRPKIISDKGFYFLDPGKDGYVVVGCDNAELEEPALGVMQKEAKLGEEAYHISTVNKYRQVVVVRGGGVRGCLFGIARLIEKLRIEPGDIYKINLEEAPAFSIRIASGETPEGALLLGYNTRAASAKGSEAALLEGAEPKLFSHHETMRKEVLANRKTLRRESKRDQALGLDTVTVSDEFVFNKALLNRPLSKKLLDPKTGRLCACDPEVWKLFNEKYAELARDFPAADYTAIGMGETAPGGDYFGNSPAPEMPWSGCDKCSNAPYADRAADFISRARDAIAPAGSKRKYIQRTRGKADDSFHSQPGVYEAILRNIPNKDNLLFSMKYTKTGFWRYNFPNETIGAGGAQIVEFQSARENEGNGAFPNYIGEEYSKAYKYAKARGAAGVWNWNGANATGPEVKTGIWNDVNAYAAARLSWNPDASPEKLARDWATLNFGKQSAADITRILMMSDDAVMKILYFKAYAEKKDAPRAPNENWVHDDVIEGAAPLRAIYEASRADVDAMVTEKQQGAALAGQMMSIATGLHLPDEQRRQIMDTIRYELLTAKVLADYSCAFFLYSRWKEKGGTLDKQTAKMYAMMWRVDWADYTASVKSLGRAASPYRDGGMVAVMDKISEEVGAGRDKEMDDLKARVAVELEKAGLRK